MTSTDIIRIIKACKDVGLKSLEYSGLVLKFKDVEGEDAVTWTPSTPRTMNLVDNKSILTHNENIPVSDEEDDELLKIEDPLEWERRQVENG